jgi:hypothetical protein
MKLRFNKIYGIILIGCFFLLIHWAKIFYFQLETLNEKNEYPLDYTRRSIISNNLQNKLAKIKDDDLLILSIEINDLDQDEIHYKTHQYLSSIHKEKNNLLGFSFIANPKYTLDDFNLSKLQLSKREYLNYHNSIFQMDDFMGKPLYQSQFSPFQVIVLSKKEILKLQENPLIVSMDLMEELEGGHSSGVAFPSTGLNFTMQNMGLRGKDVKIGLIEYEGYPYQKAFPALYNTKMIYDFNQGQIKIGDFNFHASFIASILSGSNGIIPDATLYATSVTNGSSFYEKVEWLIHNNVDLINFSGYVNSKGDGNYGHVSKWIDYITSQYNITFVNAVGNSDDRPIYTSSLAYNAIVVGAMNTRGTITSNDDVMYEFSSYRETDVGPLKPDLTAPGQISMGGDLKGIGTSISTPLVSATVANIIEYKPFLKNYPEAIKAILAASAIRKTAIDYGIYPSSLHYSDKEGAGVLNSRQAINWIVRNNRYLVTEIDYSKNFIKNLSVNKDETYRVALAWNKTFTASSTNLRNFITDNPLVDLDLYVVNENRKIIARSVTSHNNLELLRFKATETGNYRIVVKPFKADLQKGRIGLAWW